MTTAYVDSTRPLISLKDGKVHHSGQDKPCRVVLHRDKISVGCSDMTIEAAEFLIAEHRKAFPRPVETVVLQP